MMPQPWPGSREPKNATASWSAVTERQGASLPRRHRFRGVKHVLRPYPALQPAKAASRLGLPHALQDAPRSRERWGLQSTLFVPPQQRDD